MIVTLRIDDVNPTPWMAPEGQVRRNGKKSYVQMHSPAAMTNYKKAIRECMAEAYPGTFDLDAAGKAVSEPLFPKGTPLTVIFFYWRRLDTWTTGTGRSQTAKRVDVTNLNKSTEDALQGLIYANDVDSHTVIGRMVQQSHETESRITMLATDQELPGLAWLSGNLYQPLRVDTLIPPTPPGNVRLVVDKETI